MKRVIKVKYQVLAQEKEWFCHYRMLEFEGSCINFIMMEMAICSKVGFPYLFIVFTRNPNWPEIQRVLEPLHLKHQDIPYIISRIFKMKFDQLLSNLTKKGVLGKVLACKLSKFSIQFLFHLSYVFLYNISYLSFVDMQIIEF